MAWDNSGLWELRPLVHLLFPLSVHWIAQEMTVSVLVDVITDALCPGHSTCSEAVYFSGLQQTVVGVFKMVVIPLLGQVADEYGRKPVLLLTVSTYIFPFGLLAFNQSKEFVYAYYVLGTIAYILSQGSIFCIAIAYAADFVENSKRTAAFSWITGILSASHLLGNLLALVLPEKCVFPVSVALLIFCPVYMQFFLVETIESAPRTDQESSCLTKILVLPLLNPFVGEKVILCIGLLASIAYALFYGLAWASWVPYLSASFGVIYILVQPSTYAIISKASSLNNQGKAQGFVAGVQSTASFLSPFAMSPLTSWFLSSDAPFNCKGFSILVASICMMIALCYACMLKTEVNPSNNKEEDIEAPILLDS